MAGASHRILASGLATSLPEGPVEVAPIAFAAIGSGFAIAGLPSSLKILVLYSDQSKLDLLVVRKISDDRSSTLCL